MILVTGATGILGRVVVLELLKKGKHVRACKRPTSDIKDVKSSFSFYSHKAEEFFDKIEWVDLDFKDFYSLTHILEGVTEVYHCAGEVSFNPKDKESLYQNNIVFTRELLYACQNSIVKSFCFISSISVLDDVNEQGELDEESNYNPKMEHSAYAISKHFAEMEVWRASAEGLNTVILNPGVIIGSGNWQKSSGLLFKNLIKNKYTFSGGTAYVDVRDVANIAIQLVDHSIFGNRFVLISENIKFVDIANKVRNICGLSNAKIIPNWILKLANSINFLFGWLVSPLKVASKSNIEAVSSFTLLSNDKIKKTLDYQFIPFDESIDFHLKNYQKKK